MRLWCDILARHLPPSRPIAILRSGGVSAMVKVGIVGMGVIGTHIAQAIMTGIPGVALAGVTVRNHATGSGHRGLTLDRLVAASDPVVEAATQAAPRELAPSDLGAG